MTHTSARNALFAALVLAALAVASACASGEAPKPAPDPLPELGDEKIRETLFDAWVDEVPEATGAARPISWYFTRGEPTEVAVVEKQMDGKKATVVVDVTARSAPHARDQKALSGRLRLHYELQREFILRRWRIVGVDNISMTYRDEARPDAPPENRPSSVPVPQPAT
jgi:hypothetical protein